MLATSKHQMGSAAERLEAYLLHTATAEDFGVL
jgi:hypothetical protein